MQPAQLESTAGLSLVTAGVCCVVIIADLVRYPQKMPVMNIVWPVTALYAGPLGLLVYFRMGRKNAAAPMKASGSQLHEKDGSSRNHPDSMKRRSTKPFWQSVVTGTLHCGAGCTLGDIIAEFGLLLFPPFLLAGKKLFGTWLVDYCIAFLLGIIFQYFAIKPMKHLSPGAAITAALKADTLSLTCWQVGMYGWMAIAVFVLFKQELSPLNPVFWLMMQIGMVLGFFTAFPVNWWLITSGITKDQTNTVKIA